MPLAAQGNGALQAYPFEFEEMGRQGLMPLSVIARRLGSAPPWV